MPAAGAFKASSAACWMGPALYHRAGRYAEACEQHNLTRSLSGCECVRLAACVPATDPDKQLLQLLRFRGS
jgi:hypothetical protein